MPKKKKATKKGGKAKGKKSDAKKKKEENIVSIAEASVKLWETKVSIAEKSRNQFRENATLMTLHNDSLQSQMMQTEKDTIDVISYLKTQDTMKEQQLDKLQQESKELKKEHRLETEEMVEDYSKQINELEDNLEAKNGEIELLADELKMVKEFRRKRGQMQKELEDIKDMMYSANKDHKITQGQMEQKFFEEKMRLQQEANQKIAELADKAHSEAVANLDETTRSVYKENVRLSESLNYHMKEAEALKKRNAELEELYRKYKGEREETDGVMREKVMEARDLKLKMKGLQEKVQLLELSLTHVVNEFDTEKTQLVVATMTETEAAKIEISKLQRVIELKNKEGNRVKRLAKNILDQRTEIERFFLEALEYVRSRIEANQKQYRKDAKVAYTKKMIEATGGDGEFPKIRTFSKSESSTNNVFKDLEVAETLQSSQKKVDISELTWEQKERVLRYLFGRMNGLQTGKVREINLPAIEEKPPLIVSHEEDQTFVTNQHIDNLNKLRVIPDIPTFTEVESI